MKIISLDAGGTRTTGSLIEDGTCLKTLQGNFGNLSVDYEKGLTHILELCKGLNDDAVDYVVIGLSGIGGIHQEKLNDDLKKHLNVPIKLMSDLELAYWDVLNHKDVLVVAGTGSALMCYDHDRLIQAGGWGHILGDEGSGYSLSLSIIKDAIVDYESNCLTEMMLMIYRCYEINHLEGIKTLYRKPKSYVAKLARYINEHEPKLLEPYLEREAKKLYDTLDRMINRYGLYGQTIGLTGGMFNNMYFRHRMMDWIPNDYKIIINTKEHTYGGWLWAKDTLLD